MARDNIRNFCIIAHIDHGKSTLSDRILELTKSVDERTMEDQILDNMDIERERGITIKARAVTMNYTAKDGKVYEFNLIDTPGHVDFAYEVSRSLAACEGAILVVDATQGVEAQTLANTYMALEHDLELVPILNKIDLPSAHPDEVAQEVEDVIGLPCLDAPRVSAKTGLNIDQVLERVVSDIPAPSGDPDAPLKALIFDSIYDSYKGVIVYIRVFEGTVKPGDTIRLMATGAQFTLVEVGHMGATSLTPCDQLQAGEVGYLTASIKTVQDTRVGDTVTLANNPTPEALPGYRQVKPMVFCRAGLRLPLRLPWPAPHGDHHRASGTRVRPRPHHHHTQRPLSSDPDRRHRGDDRQPVQLPRPLQHRQAGGALRGRPPLHPQRIRRQPDGPVPEQARRPHRHEVYG